MPRRRDARQFALQMLFLVDQNEDADVKWIREKLEVDLKDPAVSQFAWRLFSGVREARDQLDAAITEVAANWRIDRMSITDRNVLRMGLFALTDVGTPAAVVLDESIEIAKEFGSENSGGFVNGILDKLASQKETKS